MGVAARERLEQNFTLERSAAAAGDMIAEAVTAPR